MKKNFMIFLTVIASLLFLTTFSTTKADENIDNNGGYEVRTSLVMKVGDSATQVFTDKSGQKNVVTVTKVADGPQTGITPLWDYVHSEKASNGTYHVNYIRGVFNCGFYITIDTRNITSAYDLWYFNLTGTNSANLVHENNRRATAYFTFQGSIPWINGPSWSGALRAQLDADHLVTMVK